MRIGNGGIVSSAFARREFNVIRIKQKMNGDKR